MDLEFSEISQTETNPQCFHLHMESKKKKKTKWKQIHRYREQTSGYQSGERWKKRQYKGMGLKNGLPYRQTRMSQSSGISALQCELLSPKGNQEGESLQSQSHQIPVTTSGLAQGSSECKNHRILATR